MSAIGQLVWRAGFRGIVFAACAAPLLASGTVTPASRIGGYNRCSSSTVEGIVSAVDIETGELTMKTKDGDIKKLKADDRTRFRVPGAAKEVLRDKPLSTISVDSKTRASYCTKDDTLVEVRVLKRD